MPAKPSAPAPTGSDLEASVEAELAGRPFLIYRDEHDSQQLFLLTSEAASATIGRLPPSDLLLDWDEQVSRLHARLERVDDGWEVSDDGLSRNGTFLNGERLSGSRRLKDGDTLRFGMTTVTFRSPQPEKPGAADAGLAAAAVGLSTTQRRVLLALWRAHEADTAAGGPPSDEQIADELFLSVGAVRTHLRVLCAKLGVEPLPEEEMRARLIERALAAGLISERDV